MQKIEEKVIMVTAEEQVIIQPWMGILNSVFPILELLFVIAIVALALFIVWKRQPFKSWGSKVLLKHKRGEDFTPELTEGRREKNKDTKQWGYRLRNGDWVPSQLFKNLRPMGKKAFLELWEDESGKYIPAPSPFETKREYDVCPKCGREAILETIKDAEQKDVSVWKCAVDGIINPSPLKVSILTGYKNNPDEFTQADTNWLIEQFRNDVTMFTKKSAWQQWIPIIVPAVTIMIVVLALIIFITNGLLPMMDKFAGLVGSFDHSSQLWANITTAAAQANQVTIIPTGK